MPNHAHLLLGTGIVSIPARELKFSRVEDFGPPLAQAQAARQLGVSTSAVFKTLKRGDESVIQNSQQSRLPWLLHSKNWHHSGIQSIRMLRRRGRVALSPHRKRGAFLTKTHLGKGCYSSLPQGAGFTGIFHKNL